MDKTEQELTRNQLKAMPIILEAKNITQGVKKAGISRNTFYLWLKIPEFRTEFLRREQEIVDLAAHELKAAASEAVIVMRDLLKAKNDGIRLRTAVELIKYVFSKRKIDEVDHTEKQMTYEEFIQTLRAEPREEREEIEIINVPPRTS